MAASHPSAARSFLLALLAAGAEAPSPRSHTLRILLLQARGNGATAFMHQPAWATLIRGLVAYSEAHPDTVDVAWGSCTEAELAQRLPQELGRNDLFVWLGAGLPDAVPWRSLHERGVRSVWYRTEYSHGVCHYAGRYLGEVWDFTWANALECWTQYAQEPQWEPLARYLPPGALPTARAGHLLRPPPLVFLGDFWSEDSRHTGPQWQGRRRACLERIRAALPIGALRPVYSLWNETAYAQAMASLSIFLSVHRGCDVLNQPLEAFRVAKLLNYGGLVISETSHADDMASFDGLVDFAPSIDAIPAMYTKLLRMRHKERVAVAERRRIDFQRRFAPERLFEEAEVYAMLDALREGREPSNRTAYQMRKKWVGR